MRRSSVSTPNSVDNTKNFIKLTLPSAISSSRHLRHIPLPLKSAFTGYFVSTTTTLLSHLYAHYAKILATYLAENNRNLQETYNIDKPLKSSTQV